MEYSKNSKKSIVVYGGLDGVIIKVVRIIRIQHLF